MDNKIGSTIPMLKRKTMLANMHHVSVYLSKAGMYYAK
jgi:hypothetical protein